MFSGIYFSRFASIISSILGESPIPTESFLHSASLQYFLHSILSRKAQSRIKQYWLHELVLDIRTGCFLIFSWSTRIFFTFYFKITATTRTVGSANGLTRWPASTFQIADNWIPKEESPLGRTRREREGRRKTMEIGRQVCTSKFEYDSADNPRSRG